ncbi:MAG: hypothetical protein EWV58_08105 [Microcystis aeruginosa Ma_MB_F_20061100_S19]|uniref:Uncharacterized protein n=1 Tax=Microcystis aeruginosa SPC777 TaxID=482300 RepID=S3J6J6_MICAE|nr:hypothetical protein [Microcystis aeruginosa]EPF20231.1 hypothetical protein MAESPC_03302 [Microcystis aeruginosa SPC777]NCR97661.1 hypothetical protein [Microcystis aeruginosa L311-01]TRU16162.1 MAG: hypothetical protein EWV58_08105 [Microcystis aeruginosa Ma_MB_F_20061100_S19]TRU16192.1 MAG: hypothetical protein EWV59_02405 [Microcystis aeruginosa Ma_MB_F_20061100_S19D]
MEFKSIKELREYLRRYNSNSFLEVGTSVCWQEWQNGGPRISPLEQAIKNSRRNYALRLILLASAGNPYRNQAITFQEFESLIDVLFNCPNHTISDKTLLDTEAEYTFNYLHTWEQDNYKTVRNWKLLLSDIFTKELIRKNGGDLFSTRQALFQNSGFGKPLARVQRTMKVFEILNSIDLNTINFFESSTKLNHEFYFVQFMSSIGYFLKTRFRGGGVLDFKKSFDIDFDDELKSKGYTEENLRIFVRLNSRVFSSSDRDSFRNIVTERLNNTSEVYHPFFYNSFLDYPFIDLGQDKYCLPDPYSLMDSSWNIICKHLPSSNKILDQAFEQYLANVLLPIIAPNCFEKIREVENPQSSHDKRADFLITLPNVYIIIECKNSLMSSDTSVYFDPKGLASLWGRIHGATEQISSTIEALKLKDKPVIPLILTFYDALLASNVFESIVKSTDYCDHLNLSMPPIVRSLHEFEHWIYNRSLQNWAESMLLKQSNSSINPDNQGHNYRHLKDFY